MAYSDFTLNKLEQKFGLLQRRTDLFQKPTRKIKPSIRLKADLEDAKHFPLLNEKVKSELITTPILKELWRRNEGKFTFFSGFTFDVDTEQSLNGVCDYLLSTATNSIEIKAPVFCLVEAKNRAIEEGLGQCAAEMYAARLYNKEFGLETNIIYGAVTNAFDWVFLKLENNTITIDTDRYFINDLSALLGVLQQIIDFYL